MSTQTNIGKAFPLESLGSDIARNSFNYQSILNGLIEWNVTSEDTVLIRLAKDTSPWYQDFQIPSKKSVFSTNGYMSSHKGVLGSKFFSVPSLMNIATYGGTIGDPEDMGDIITLRLAVRNAGKASWGVYYSPFIYDWVSGMDVREGNLYRDGVEIYRALNTLNSLTEPSLDPSNFTKFYKEWVLGDSYYVGDYVLDDGLMYVTTTESIPSLLKPSQSTEFTLIATEWNSSVEYTSGSYVFYLDSLYLATEDILGDLPNNSDKWAEHILVKLPQIPTFNDSVVVKWESTVDTRGLILRNEHNSESTIDADIYLQYSVKTKGTPSIYQKSVDVISTSNYSLYPENKSPVWSENAKINNTDPSLDIKTRQDYSAIMVFDHANQEQCKTINFINYDGPDLDQGLCIYLPIESELEDSTIVEPEDGFTYEFYFRIWPNVNYTTNTVTRDHIVNKSQIYVYNANNKEAIKNNACSTPIAKFSMARMSNFHVFAENITIPDKPVVYRATFIYSKSRIEWMLYDYYQLPDHVFVGPIGFIDPQNPSNSDYNSPELSNINPDAKYIGYETCAFPTYVDVFSNPDLKPYRSSDGKFHNREA